MREKLRFLGRDVHAETIAVAIAEPDGEVRSLGTIPNRMESLHNLMKKLGPVDKLRVCYEAGPTGYVLFWKAQHRLHKRYARLAARVKTRGRSSQPWAANCWVLSGP